jgi:TRAP transporter TAXI family solute receptor
MIRWKTLKTLTLAAAIGIAGLAAAGCGGDGGEEAGGPADTPRPAAQRRFLSLGTAPPGGAFFVVGGALAETLDANRGPHGWRVTAEATKGTQENIRRLARGELDLALANSAITYFAVRGEEGWERPYEMASVMTLAPNVALFVSPEGSGVRRVADLRGRRVVTGPAGAGFEYFLRPILAAHGLSLDDFTPLAATQSGAVDLLADGAADAAFLGGAVPTASITQAAASEDLVFVPYEQAAIEELAARYPFFQRTTIPAGTYRGLDADYAGLDVGSMHLIARADEDPELVYQVTRTLWENRAQVVERHPAGRAIRPTVVVRDLGTPFHPGAVRFYREIGVWPEE